MMILCPEFCLVAEEIVVFRLSQVFTVEEQSRSNAHIQLASKQSREHDTVYENH